jgi:DnaJ-domain-containing protein 1
MRAFAPYALAVLAPADRLAAPVIQCRPQHRSSKMVKRYRRRCLLFDRVLPGFRREGILPLRMVAVGWVMVEEFLSSVLAFAPGSAPMMGLLVMLPGLFVCYVHYCSSTRDVSPDLSLRTLESIELRRAVMLYEMASKRIKEGCAEFEKRKRSWRQVFVGERNAFGQQFREELEDLEAYARDLRSTIIRLRHRPFERYKAWAHVVSARFALGRSLGLCALILALMVGLFCYIQPILWAPGIDASFKTLVLWEAMKGRLLLANWMAVNFVAVAIPTFYLFRRARLHRKHRPEIQKFKAFAAADPDQLIEEGHEEETASEAPAPEIPETIDDGCWHAILGVPPSATLEEIKHAYKTQIKKNHPDRVHDMSASFMKLAESETKKLNAAYAEALLNFQQTTA